MTLYLDTSVLVAALTNEAATARVQSWLGGVAAETLAISDWVVTEVSSALSIKLRTGSLTLPERAATLAMLQRMARDNFDVWPVAPADFRSAALMADQFATGVRAGDALHLAVCAGRGATLCTLDRKLAEAGAAHGVATLTP